MLRGYRFDRRTSAGDVWRYASSIEHIEPVSCVRCGDHGNALGRTPDIPTVDEFVPGYEATAWLGLGAPKNTRAEIIDKLNEQINAALVDPKIKTRLADLGGTVLPGSPADFGRLMAEETEKWAKVVKFAGLKPE
jgi:tripartite-type tricarboxylate transporter receptor subunit TctC